MLRTIGSSVAFTCVLALSGCFVEGQVDTGTTVASRGDLYVRRDPVVVNMAPPPPQVTVETRPPQPVSGAMWVDGYWDNQGGGWVWVGGHWDTPRAGYVWTAPVGVQVEGGFRYHPGYWRPANEPPHPDYTAGGVVCVGLGCGGGVQTGGGVVVNTPPPQGGGVYVQGGGVQPAGGGAVVVNTPPPQGGGVYVQGGGVQQPPQGGGVVVTGGGGVHTGGGVVVGGGGVQQPPQGGGVVVGGGGGVHTGGGVVVGGGVQQPPQGGGVVVGGGGGGVTANTNVRPGGVQVGTVQQPAGGGVVANTTVRPGGGVQAGTVQAGGGMVANTNVRPGGGVQAGVAHPVGNTTVGGVQAGTVVQAPLTCRASNEVVMRGGQYVVSGTGFQAGAHALIGGSYAAVGTVAPTQISVQVPNTSPGGMVEVEQGGQRISCGQVRATGAGGH